jgi:diguanylate cyclase (GGDEF)-like protein
MRSAGLHVLLGQPRQALLAAPKQHLRQGLIMLAGAALMLFVGVGSLVEWGLRRQVVRIVSMVQELGAGNADARIPQPHPRGELGGLMAVLNRTADSLQAQRQAIDQLAQELQTAHGREIAEREENELRLSRMANFDSLTGLPNRALFQDRLQQAITRSRRLARPFALMFLDIDRFKNINDSLGHDVGDRLLKAVAQTLATTVREVDTVSLRDGPGRADEVFRLGGDEFMVLAEDLSDTGAAMGIARRVLVALDCAFVVDDHELFISASIGITLHGGDGVDMDGLIKQADLAMYRAKELGRGTWCFYDETMNQVAIQRHQLEMGLRRALERQEFVLHYQPKADLKTGRITGIEALLRWQPAGQAMVAPDRFITVLEETGLIVPVGEWVLREACSQMVRWQAQGMRAIGLAVNLSARQFRHHDLAAQISAILGETGLAPALLEVELTESMLLDDTDAVLSTLTALGAMGVRIAIDDFGTGHSSLRYIQRFSVDTLKIDRSFVRQTPGNADDCAIATAVIALGRSMGLKVVAEGVETPAQMEFLASQACDEMQGYLLSRPLDPGKFFDWLSCRESSEQAAAV